MPGKAALRRVTLTTVAEAAGVSVPTVSKVVNGRSDVAPETRTRIQQLLVEHGYAGRTAVGPTATTTLAMAFDAMRTPNNLEMIRGATEAAAAANADVVVEIVPEDHRGTAWAERAAAVGHRGLVLVTTRVSRELHTAFVRVGVPVVLIDPVDIPHLDVPSVGATNFNGGIEAADHLLALGHRRVGFIQGPPDALVSVARLHGYHATLSRAGIASDPALLHCGPFTFETGLRAGHELLSLPERPTAVFASNDLQALGVIEAARSRSLRVPEDLSVVGFDDMAPARWSAPPLTTVRQPFAEMGRVAVRNLLSLVDGDALAAPRVELATHLVVRGSTAPPWEPGSVTGSDVTEA
jgi:LacI family transcriptional regulator